MTPNYNLPRERQRRLISPTEAVARKWAERWAAANLERLQRECQKPERD